MREIAKLVGELESQKLKPSDHWMETELKRETSSHSLHTHTHTDAMGDYDQIEVNAEDASHFS